MSKLRAPSRSVEVFIVDAPGAAARALGEHRPTAESTHVLCRHADESASDFQKRVLDRTERISTCRRIRALWYVVGSEVTDTEVTDTEVTDTEVTDTDADLALAEERPGPLPLLETLVPMLETGASLTVVGPGSHQGAVFTWLDSLIPQHRARVTVRAQLYPSSYVSAAGTQRRAPLRSSPVSLAAPLRSPSHEAEVPLAESA